MGLNKTQYCIKKDFLVNLFVLLVVKFDFSLRSSVLVFTFTSSGSYDFNIKLISMISYTPAGDVYPFVEPVIQFRSKISIISSNVS